MHSKKQKGKVVIKQYFQTFSIGDSVVLKALPTIQKGRYPLRFHGTTGKVVGKQGGSYFVQIKDGNKSKKVLVNTAHLKKLDYGNKQ